jgi:hypothetical protein
VLCIVIPPTIYLRARAEINSEDEVNSPLKVTVQK